MPSVSGVRGHNFLRVQDPYQDVIRFGGGAQGFAERDVKCASRRSGCQGQVKLTGTFPWPPVVAAGDDVA